MSYGVYLANQLEGRLSTLERQLAEQAEQIRQKDEMIRALARALVHMTRTATGLHLLYRGATKAESDGSHEKLFADALTLVEKAKNT